MISAKLLVGLKYFMCVQIFIVGYISDFRFPKSVRINYRNKREQRSTQFAHVYVQSALDQVFEECHVTAGEPYEETTDSSRVLFIHTRQKL